MQDVFLAPLQELSVEQLCELVRSKDQEIKALKKAVTPTLGYHSAKQKKGY
jgi:hypothetical protein